ncbi:unnamed protein product [Caenorhabditis sp. 36 PRJEB53466]|nr:unnamed protein product [Caenorhabditis sp. 36 PRJEB53466]
MSLNMTDITMSTKKKVSEATSHLRVAVRVRPMNGTERSEKCSNIVKVEKSKMTVSLKGKSFGPFFRVYDADTTQSDIYEDLVSSQIKKVIAGFNCTVFAYGQTGTGKTFTMEGGRTDVKSSHDDPTTGIIPRAVEDIFEQLETLGCEEYSLRVSYVELYNEELFDLLASADSDDRERLRIFDDPNKKGVIVSGVEEVPVRNRADVFKLLEIGAEKRRTAATLMNMHSSRSHSLFMVNVVVRENTHTGEELVKQGKLNLVDLAGSENIGRSGAQGNRAKEAGSINQSLLTLGRVIRSLTTSAQHIPYRESKLTRLLQDSLGGSTITSLIATMSPSSSNFEEGQSTLEYAMRAANIKNKPVCNTKVSKKTILKEYSDEIEKLRRDLRAAREKNGVIISEESHEEFQRNTEKVYELEQQLDYVVDRLRRFTEDLMHMDEQYKQLYERKGALEDRLRERLREMAEKEKELADTKDELSNYMEALGQMHTASLKSFDQLLKTHDAAEEMVTDLRAFWKKVDEMKKADDTNKSTVEVFMTKMNAFVVKMTEQTESMKVDATAVVEELVDEIQPACEELDTLSEEIGSKRQTLEDVSTICFKNAAAIEKSASEKVTGKSTDIRAEWETALKTVTRYYKGYSENSDALKTELLERLDEVKRQVAAFADDVRPLLTEIRGTVCENVEERTEKSKETVDFVKDTYSKMAENMKKMLIQFEQLALRVEKDHEEQVVADQVAESKILSDLNTVETLVQSVEDIVEEQCDATETSGKVDEALKTIDADFDETVKSAGRAAVENENRLTKLVTDLCSDAEANRSESMTTLSSLFQNLSECGKKCSEAGEKIYASVNESGEKMKTVLNGTEEASTVCIQEAEDVLSRVSLHHVNPTENVPERVVPSYPRQDELNSPPEPETLLIVSDNADESVESNDGYLAKKKRRVTSFVRRDSLLDTTNTFMSPTSMQKKREQTIEEEEGMEN